MSWVDREPGVCCRGRQAIAGKQSCSTRKSQSVVARMGPRSLFFTLQLEPGRARPLSRRWMSPNIDRPQQQSCSRTGLKRWKDRFGWVWGRRLSGCGTARERESGWLDGPDRGLGVEVKGTITGQASKQGVFSLGRTRQAWREGAEEGDL